MELDRFPYIGHVVARLKKEDSSLEKLTLDGDGKEHTKHSSFYLGLLIQMMHSNEVIKSVEITMPFLAGLSLTEKKLLFEGIGSIPNLAHLDVRGAHNFRYLELAPLSIALTRARDLNSFKLGGIELFGTELEFSIFVEVLQSLKKLKKTSILLMFRKIEK